VSGARAQASDGAATADRETALLLDPCRDDPETELEFLEDGTVQSTTERGRNTIEVFALNRASLVEARRDICGRVDGIGNAFLDDNRPELWTEDNFVKAVMSEVPEDWGFFALARQQAQRHLARAQAQVSAKMVAAAPEDGARKRGARKSADPAPARIVSYKPALAARPYQGAIWLRRVVIENFKALRHLELQFPDHTTPLPIANQEAEIVQQAADVPASQPWIMLLGENGVGKSTVLKAIALAMMSEEQRRKLGSDARTWLSRGAGRRASSGMVRLEFTVGAEPIELHFNRRETRALVRGEPPDMPVLGYGSTRLLPQKARRRRAERCRVLNLFDSRAPLSDAEPWLASTTEVTRAQFNLLATAIKDLLSWDDDDQILRRKARLFATVNGDYGPIRDLSDGYQSVLALATDMMLNLSRATFDMNNVEGVVLLDELEVHLHPRWKIAIVGALRKAFPRVRFIASTHDPLCVQGIRKGELHVITRQGEHELPVIEQVDVRPGMRADQILTGEWFGVPTTRDPETLALMREHSQLLQKRERTDGETTRFQQLDRELRKRLDEYIGTEDEQIALQAVADLRSQDRERVGTAGVASAAELRAKVLEVLRKRPEA